MWQAQPERGSLSGQLVPWCIDWNVQRVGFSRCGNKRSLHWEKWKITYRKPRWRIPILQLSSPWLDCLLESDTMNHRRVNCTILRQRRSELAFPPLYMFVSGQVSSFAHFEAAIQPAKPMHASSPWSVHLSRHGRLWYHYRSEWWDVLNCLLT